MVSRWNTHACTTIAIRKNRALFRLFYGVIFGYIWAPNHRHQMYDGNSGLRSSPSQARIHVEHKQDEEHCRKQYGKTVRQQWKIHPNQIEILVYKERSKYQRYQQYQQYQRYQLVDYIGDI